MASASIATTVLADVTIARIFPTNDVNVSELNSHWKDQRLIIRVAATGTFRLNYVITTDGGTTLYVAKQVTASTVTVDGNTALFVKVAELDVPVCREGQVQIYNASGGNINYVADVREYYAGG